MNTKVNNQKTRGFTIIEVMIVLTIAGLIMLIVFLAVPALQRNSRNTQRRQDVSALLAAAGDYASNNAGQMPTGNNVAFNSATAFATSYPKLGYYTTPANVKWYHVSTAYAVGSEPTVPSGTDTVSVYDFLKCSGNVASASNATQRSIVALFNVEGSSGAVPQCVES